jgi:hypothetical protein
MVSSKSVTTVFRFDRTVSASGHFYCVDTLRQPVVACLQNIWPKKRIVSSFFKARWIC